MDIHYQKCVRKAVLAAVVRATAILGVVVVTGCDGLGSSSAPPTVVLESYYISNENLGVIRLSRTASIDDIYDSQSLAVRDAAVRVEMLAADGSIEEVFDYEYVHGPVYQATDAAAMVQPGRTYRLIAEMPDDGVVTARTTVPGAFEIRRISATTVEYQSDEQLEFDVTRSFVAGRQAIFVFSLEAGDPRAEMLTPLYAEIVDDDVDQVRITESPPVNEQNYDINDDGTLTIRVPWLAVAFYGPNEVIANSIDDNLYDFLRSQFVQQGGSTFAPGEIPNVIEHVEGGTGVFGSLSRVSAQVEIRREEDGGP